MMQRAPEDRFMMGIEMFETARTIAVSSFPSNISSGERNVRLLMRFYGHEFDEKSLDEIKNRLLEKR